MTLQEDVVVY